MNTTTRKRFDQWKAEHNDNFFANVTPEQAAEMAWGAATQPHPSDASTKRTANFGLTYEDLEQMLQASLKPDEIGGPPDVQHERVHELVLWFRRLANGNANPKWTTRHAFELAFYIASNGINRTIDLAETKKAAYLEGANISPTDRGILERLNLINSPSTTCDRAPAGWTCSRAKDHYGPCAAIQEEVKA